MAGADKSKLRDPLPNVVTAIEELAEVLTGGTFDAAQFWGATDEAAAGAYMDTLTVNPALKGTIAKVTGKVPGVKGAFENAANAIKGFINDVTATSSQVTGDVIPAINQLNTPPPPGTYGNSPSDNFGFIPAVLGVGTAAGANMTGVQDSVNTALGVANDAVAYAYFTVLSTKVLAMLTNALAG